MADRAASRWQLSTLRYVALALRSASRLRSDVTDQGPDQGRTRVGLGGVARAGQAGCGWLRGLRPTALRLWRGVYIGIEQESPTSSAGACWVNRSARTHPRASITRDSQPLS